jgi:hypothetical protein
LFTRFGFVVEVSNNNVSNNISKSIFFNDVTPLSTASIAPFKPFVVHLFFLIIVAFLFILVDLGLLFNQSGTLSLLVV